MRSKQENFHKNKRNWLPGRVFLVAFVLMMVMLPGTVDAAQYYVWGRVYCAFELPGDEAPPINPLTGVPGDQIVGENMIASFPRNLVNVRVLAASDGSELGSAIAMYDGGYFIGFTASGATTQVTFVVEDLATSDILLESEPEELGQWPTPNIRYLLTLDLTEINDDREYAQCSDPAKYVGIFTRVGLIELQTEWEGTTHRLIDTTTGLVNVPSGIATYLGIDAYQDAPFGGNLYMFGAFSENLYSMGAHYRIRIDNLDTSTWTYMDDPLIKTKYTVDLATLTVATDRVQLGPDYSIDGTPLYAMTPLSVGNEFWSFPDLLALWRTGGLNGNYKVSIEIVGPPPIDICTPIPNFTNLRLTLDNTAPSAAILPLYSGAGDTPRMYTRGNTNPPGPTVTTPYDLLDLKLGTNGNYGTIPNPICAVLKYANPGDHLAFKLTAFHDNGVSTPPAPGLGDIVFDGFLRYWYVAFNRNDNKPYQKIIGKHYNGTTNTMEDYTGLRITTCTISSPDGFQEKYLYLNEGHVDLGSPDGCAYRFIIRAATRTTDGYNYLRWAGDEDSHCLKKEAE
jgi:hypothetical protein